MEHGSELICKPTYILLWYPFINMKLEGLHATHITKVKMRENPSHATSETYNTNMSTFDNGKPE